MKGQAAFSQSAKVGKDASAADITKRLHSTVAGLEDESGALSAGSFPTLAQRQQGLASSMNGEAAKTAFGGSTDSYALKGLSGTLGTEHLRSFAAASTSRALRGGEGGNTADDDEAFNSTASDLHFW